MRLRIAAIALAVVAAATLTACGSNSKARVFTIVSQPKGKAYVLCATEGGPSFRVAVSDSTAAKAKVGDKCPAGKRS